MFGGWSAVVTQIPEIGWIDDLPNSAYHNLESHISSHGLMDLLDSPAHYRARRLNRKQTPAMRFGSIVHSAVLEPHDFLSRAAIQPDFGSTRTKDGKEKLTAWKAEQEAKNAIILDQEEFDTIAGMLGAITNHPLASQLFKDGHAERSGFWVCPRFGVRCRFRTDYIRTAKTSIFDYKTAEKASFSAFQGSAARYFYDLQAAFYCEGASQIEGVLYENFVFVVQEKEPPYAIAVYVADPYFLIQGKKLMEKGMRIYKECVEKNFWPGYPVEAVNLSLPAWADRE